jgi:hypothetical protein
MPLCTSLVKATTHLIVIEVTPMVLPLELGSLSLVLITT